ncbi:ZBTB9 isoform 4, partial [Pan troglodytes]
IYSGRLRLPLDALPAHLLVASGLQMWQEAGAFALRLSRPQYSPLLLLKALLPLRALWEGREVNWEKCCKFRWKKRRRRRKKMMMRTRGQPHSLRLLSPREYQGFFPVLMDPTHCP